VGVAIDNITSQTNDLTISGTAEANTLVALFNGTTSLGTVTADASGNFIKNINLYSRGKGYIVRFSRF
jgi:hypothetical protein